MKTSTGGLLMGADGLVGDWRLGVLAGYGHSSFDVTDRASSGKSDNYTVGLYGGRQWGSLALRGGLAYTWSDISTSRPVAIPGFADSLDAGYAAGTTQAFGELGYGMQAAAFRFEPFASLAYVSLSTDGFTEQGGAAALASSGQTTDATFTTLGLRASTSFDLAGMQATARGMLGWRHAYGSTTPLASVAFAGTSAFTIAGVPIARDAAIIETGLDMRVSDNATLGVSYSGQLAAGAQDHGFKATSPSSSEARSIALASPVERCRWRSPPRGGQAHCPPAWPRSCPRGRSLMTCSSAITSLCRPPRPIPSRRWKYRRTMRSSYCRGARRDLFFPSTARGCRSRRSRHSAGR